LRSDSRWKYQAIPIAAHHLHHAMHHEITAMLLVMIAAGNFTNRKGGIQPECYPVVRIQPDRAGEYANGT
jgi:hypothetical protein